ncbi:MAG: hypothetical protein N2109_08825 [Fimbriimonadales bacterium]|nr:hypothetical protein [Fimbriimonadales bacterium]
MKNRTICIALAVVAAFACAPWASAQSKRSAQPKKPAAKAVSGAENGLGGIFLYDSAMKLIQRFGSPDEIEPLNVGGAAAGPAGGMGGRGVGPMGPMGGGMPPMMGPTGGGPVAGPGQMMPPGGPGGGGLNEPDFQIRDWLGDTLNARQMGAGGRQGGGMPPGGMPPGYSGGPSFGPGGPGGMPSIGPAGAGNKGPGAAGGPSAGPGMMGPPGMGGFGPFGPGGPMGPMGGAPSGGAGMNFGSQATTRVVNTRWVYKRNGTRFGFIIDHSNRIVQIEAIALSNPGLRTRRGVTFGATFADIMRKYGAPDAYEIGGNTIVMRYLVKHKVAFRLNRLGVDKPHQVTGIVVAAGKS